MTSGPLSQQEGKKKKVLFVDNEHDITSMLKMALERVGFSTDTFNDPLLALKSFKPNSYDLVMLDVMMPKMNGFELYEQLKRADQGAKVCFPTASNKQLSKYKLVEDKTRPAEEEKK